MHPALSLVGGFDLVRKGWGVPAYSAFQGADAGGRGLAAMLAAADVRRLVFCGIATDYCVQASVEDAARLGFDVELLVDLTAAVDPTGAAAVVDALRVQGVRTV